MATSGTYSFSVTRDDIIREAMLNIGKLDVYGSIDPVETADCARKLNMMVKTWMGTIDFAPGLKMWTRQRGDLFLSQTQYRYAIGPTGDNWAGGVTAIPGANFGTDQLSVSAAAAATNIYTGVGLDLQLHCRRLCRHPARQRRHFQHDHQLGDGGLWLRHHCHWAALCGQFR